MTDPIIIVDALSAGIGKRLSSRDSIGCGPRAVAGIFESQKLSCRIVRSESIIKSPRMIRRFSHVAISGMTMDLPIVKQIVLIWRKHNRSGRIILGGPIASDTIPILKSVKPDVLVWGEGEETLTELIKKNYLDEDIDLSVVQGIGFFEGAIPKVTPVRAPLLSRTLWKRFFPSTTRIVDYPAYQASKVYVEVIRGCSNYGRTTLPLPDGRECTDCSNCTSEDSFQRTICPEEINPGCGFCSVPTVWGPPRSRETDSIVQEVEELLELGVRRVVLEAPDFLDYFRGSEPLTSPCIPVANIDAIVALVERIQNLIQIASKEAYLSIENMKACLFTEEVAKRLSDVIGASSPNIGLETGSEIHSKQIGKCGTPEDVVRSVRLARKYGMTPFVYFIYGLPGETEQTVEESKRIMRLVAEAGAERIILYGFRPLPDSAFAEHPSPSPTDPLSEPLRIEAARINREKKVDYVGQHIRGIAAEPSWERHGYTILYPLGEGPLMTVKGGWTAGTLLDIEVVEVLSPGLLLGEVIRSEE